MAVRKPHNTDHRKGYPLVFQISLIAALLLLILAFRWDYAPAQPPTYDLQTEEPSMFEEVVQTKHQETLPLPPQPPAPVEVPDDALIEKEVFRIDADISLDTPLPTLEPPSHEAENSKEPETETIFVAVEEMPEPIGGLRAIQREIKYPPTAQRARVEGKVTIQFVINEQGTVQDAMVLKGLGGGCDEEALRVVKQARFKPGKQRGKAVKVKMSLPITFRLR